MKTRKEKKAVQEEEKRQKRIKTKKPGVWALFFGAAFLAYYLICGFGAGFFRSQVWIWLAGAAIFFAYALLINIAKGRLRRFIKITAVVFTSCGLLAGAVGEACVISGMMSDYDEELDYVIILGAKVNGVNPSYALYKRIEKACEYLNKYKNTIAICSGGQGPDEGISEAECIKRSLVRYGIDPGRIITEDKSTSTDENLEYSFRYIENGASVGIITNNYHVFRAMKMADKYKDDNETYGIASEFFHIILPHYMVRELLSMVNAIVKGSF